MPERAARFAVNPCAGRCPRPRLSAARALFFRGAAGLFAGLVGCGGGGPSAAETPTAALASTREAQVEYRSIVRRWAGASRAERAAMEPTLAAFPRRFPGDDLGRIILALRGWAALENGDFDRAEAISAEVQAKGAGTAKDIALVVEGAALRRRGQPEAALAKLSPIVSKLIDSYVRALLNEESASAALMAKRWKKAVELMDVWLREAEVEEHAGVRGRITELIPRVPPEELAQILDARVARAAGAEPEDDELEMRRILAQQLARVARERRDIKLAQRLMATSGPLLGAQGEAVAQLAAGSGKARVEAPTVGLLLSMRSDAARRRGAEVAAGVMNGLGLPGSAARIVSRNDGVAETDAQEAMNALAAEGAAILIAGFEEEGAAEAARFAEARGIPVILLTPPTGAQKPQASEFVFVLGVGTDAARDALAAGLTERGASRLALVVKPALPGVDARTTTHFATATTHVCGAPLNLASWRDLGVDGVLLDGDAECSRSVIAASSGLRSMRFGFTVDAAPKAPPAGSLLVTAGLFPIVAPATDAPWLATWRKQSVTPPSFWSALGRDAAVLAWAGVEALPTQGTEDPKEVQARRISARDALSRATADLWTTQARGFEGARVLPRRIGVTEIKAGGRQDGAR